jgi:hypothetical protein
MSKVTAFTCTAAQLHEHVAKMRVSVGIVIRKPLSGRVTLCAITDNTCAPTHVVACKYNPNYKGHNGKYMRPVDISVFTRHMQHAKAKNIIEVWDIDNGLFVGHELPTGECFINSALTQG